MECLGKSKIFVELKIGLIRIGRRFQTKLKTWVRFQIGVDFSSAIFVVFRFCYVLRFAKSVLTFIVKSTRGDMAL